MATDGWWYGWLYGWWYVFFVVFLAIATVSQVKLSALLMHYRAQTTCMLSMHYCARVCLELWLHSKLWLVGLILGTALLQLWQDSACPSLWVPWGTAC